LPSGNASAVRITANSTIVSQPENVISELLSADQRVEQVGDHDHGDDQAEEVGSAHVRDEEAQHRLGAHTRSMPSISKSRIANAAIPITIATTSMASIWGSGHHARITIDAAPITIM